MSASHEHERIGDDVDPGLLPGETQGRPEDDAASQFVHGLIEHIRRDDRDAQRDRVGRVMTAIRSETGEALVPVVRHHRMRLFAVGASLASAAALVLAFLVFMVPTERTALALVQDSIIASRSVGDRTYMVRMMTRTRGEEEAQEPREIGRLYIRDSDHVVVEARAPWGGRVVIGHAGAEGWSVGPDGEVRRYEGSGRAPKWMEFGTSTLPVDSVDGLLASLPADYELTLEGGEDLDGVSCTKVVAQRKESGARFRPDRVIAWIDDSEQFIRRIELRWPERPEWEDMHRRRDQWMRENGSREGIAEGDADERGRRGLRRHGGRLGPDGPGGEFGGEPGRRREHQARGSDGERRERRDRCRLLDGSPDMKRGHHPPPPSAIIFELEDRASFDAGWFTPEAHMADPAG